ncbi:diguanylate cyclase domain-containing protein [Halomonas urumqiensis]|nr:diguanylate cyclase [Halomonas urumqiensis]
MQMLPYPIPANEHERLEVLHSLNLQATRDDPLFERITRLVSRCLDVPMAAVTLIDEHHQWLKAKVGIEGDVTPRSEAFCAHTIAGDGSLVVEDARLDERFREYPGVLAENGIRFYAGVPLRSLGGLALGALCVVDHRPRQLSERELLILGDLAEVLNHEIRQRERIIKADQRRDHAEATLAALNRDLEAEVERRSREVELIIESAYDAYICVDQHDRIADWNRAAEQMFDWPRKLAISRSLVDTLFPDGVPDFPRSLIETTARRRDGSAMPVEIRTHRLEMADGPRRVLFVHDITERLQLRHKRELEARQDLLTELPNRRALQERVPQAMARARRSGQGMVVMFIDLDGFKAVNDDLGHDAGDRLLCELASRLRVAVREVDFVARLGGDEFVVVLEGTSAAMAERKAMALIETIEQPVHLAAGQVRVSASIGLSYFSADAVDDMEGLMRRADLAMYAAKRAGKGCVRIG